MVDTTADHYDISTVIMNRNVTQIVEISWVVENVYSRGQTNATGAIVIFSLQSAKRV